MRLYELSKVKQHVRQEIHAVFNKLHCYIVRCVLIINECVDYKAIKHDKTLNFLVKKHAHKPLQNSVRKSSRRFVENIIIY